MFVCLYEKALPIVQYWFALNAGRAGCDSHSQINPYPYSTRRSHNSARFPYTDAEVRNAEKRKHWEKEYILVRKDQIHFMKEKDVRARCDRATW